MQFTSGNNTDANLARMLELIDTAAAAGADLVVFQEFCNHPALYTSPDHVWQSAVSEDGPFVGALKAKARERGVYVSFNATIRGPWPRVVDQNILLSSAGEVALTSQKQILMGSERDYFEPGGLETQVVDTELGRIGLMSCMEGLIPETPRVLAVKGADIILNSLSSNGIDEAHTHIPVRAAENGVYIVSANRSGPLVDPGDLDALTAKNGIDKSKLIGGGESQIVGPDGVSLVRAKPFEDDMVITSIDVTAARPDGLLADRRPECYGVLTADDSALAPLLKGRVTQAGEVVVAAAGIASGLSGADALQAALEFCETTDADLVVLPELFAWDPAALRESRPDAAMAFAEQVVGELSALARSRGCHVVAGLPGHGDTGRLGNCAVLIGPDQEPTWYRQVHVHPDDRGWADPGDGFVIVDLPFGRVGLLVGYDLAFPESARVLTLMGADLIACPTSWRHAWESRLVAPERSAENHVAVVAAARADSACAEPSTILSVPVDYRFPVTGEVNMPERRDAPGTGAGVVATIDLRASRDKLLMRRTDLLADRQPGLYGALVAAAPAETGTK
ncbi:carbon-nitrogen hydrolase family protein [Dactylosporangium sp. NPDC050688]|uniref:carbon-nitrogen hydrolase family protein n=1 Tax=Dactylosporangium sp. NPDC050688 TaxID=3157217 RepID=UPI003410986A